MGIIDSETGKEKKYTIKELEEIAKQGRAWVLMSTHCAGSGHPGGSLSAMDYLVSMYFHSMKHDPKNPSWEKRDRVFLSKAHCVPGLYAILGLSGYYDINELSLLRKIGTPFQGHSDMIKGGKIGIEMSGGSLGHGLGIAVGNALAAKLDGDNHKVYCIMGDGEQQEGSIWEAAMSAAKFKLNNLIAIVDNNNLQIDGFTENVMNIEPIADKYRAFNWHVIEINGHSIEEIINAFNKAHEIKDKPVCIIAKTIKGKGISYMENQASWHGNAPNKEQLELGLKELGVELPINDLITKAKDFETEVEIKIEKNIPKFSQNYWWNSQETMKSVMSPTRVGWGKSLAEIGSDERIVTLQADTAGSVKISDFEKEKPERKNRAFQMGIAEQNMVLAAAGLAKEGKIPVAGTYSVFSAGRPWEQIRTTICYGNLNVKIGGSHSGMTVGGDGATHQDLESISLMNILPNMHLFSPSDEFETFRTTKAAVLDVEGPCFLRFEREKTPVITNEKTPFEIGKANVIRFRGEKENFIDAFETVLAEEYKTENEQIAIIATGLMTAEAMRAAWILKKEFGIETRVINIHTIKPLDKDAIIKTAEEVGFILTAEDHQVGGFGNIIAGTIMESKIEKKPMLEMLGVQDKFGESGGSYQLMKKYGLTAEHIAEQVKKMLGK